jgi:hypothetical protein
MLHSALMRRIPSLLDPSEVLSTIQRMLSDVPDVERTVTCNMARKKYSKLVYSIGSTLVELRGIRDAIAQLDDIQTRIDRFRSYFLPTADLRIPTVRSIAKEVEAMERNFAKVLVGNQVVGVVTAPVVLREPATGTDVDLGPFKILLDLTAYAVNVGCDSPYRIRACDPRPPRDDSDYEHPHVCEEVLCEGEAREPIERALNEGRFFDFFHIVNNTLNVYNGRSPHVQLRKWVDDGGGRGCCNECGCDLDDDFVACMQCHELVCDSCSEYCEEGNESLCCYCARSSGSACDGCNRFGAADCLIHSNEPCSACGDVPTDDESMHCRRGFTFHDFCLSGMDELPDVCSTCYHRSRCLDLPEALREDDEQEESETEEEPEGSNDSNGSS